MAACQELKRKQGGARQLTLWMGFHGGMSETQKKARKRMATHPLDEIS